MLEARAFSRVRAWRKCAPFTGLVDQSTALFAPWAVLFLVLSSENWAKSICPPLIKEPSLSFFSITSSESLFLSCAKTYLTMEHDARAPRRRGRPRKRPCMGRRWTPEEWQRLVQLKREHSDLDWIQLQNVPPFLSGHRSRMAYEILVGALPR
jgi:hypothetical protein